MHGGRALGARRQRARAALLPRRRLASRRCRPHDRALGRGAVRHSLSTETAVAHHRSRVAAQTKRFTNANALSATPFHPLSTVSACPRLASSTISVTPALRSCRLNDACVIAHGTVWSFSPLMNSSGPRSGFSVSTFTSVHGLRFAVAAWKSGVPDAGTAKVSYSSFASLSLTAFAKA